MDKLARLRTVLLHDRLTAHRDRDVALYFHPFDGPVEKLEVDHPLANHVERRINADQQPVIEAR